jgi:heme-degrading monooxygenase HmoA
MSGMSAFASTPQPPYYAVIFTALPTVEGRSDDYARTVDLIRERAEAMPGYLGLESAGGEAGIEITVSYWASEEAIVAWKAQLDHRAAQQRGRAEWYERYEIRVARVERAYGFARATPAAES